MTKEFQLNWYIQRENGRYYIHKYKSITYNLWKYKWLNKIIQKDWEDKNRTEKEWKEKRRVERRHYKTGRRKRHRNILEGPIFLIIRLQENSYTENI